MVCVSTPSGSEVDQPRKLPLDPVATAPGTDKWQMLFAVRTVDPIKLPKQSRPRESRAQADRNGIHL